LSLYLAALDPLNTPLRVALVAHKVDSGLLAGFAVASVVAREADLESIAVAPEARRQGIGRLLLTAMVSALQGQGVNQVYLEVRAANHAATSLYRAVGFVEAKRRAAYYTDPTEDAVLMQLRADEGHFDAAI
jgi:ribosomal-protein-alanine N-acetyltransferase